MSGFKQKWDELHPNLKRYIVIGSGIALILLVVSVFAGGSSTKRIIPGSKRDATIQSVLTDADPRQAGLDAMAENINMLKRSNQELLRSVKDLQQSDKKSAEELKQTTDVKAQIEQVQRELASQQKAQAEALDKAIKEAKESALKDANAKPPQNPAAQGFQPGTQASADGKAGEYFSSAPLPEEGLGEKVPGGKKKDKMKIRTITEAVEGPDVAGKEGEDEIYIPSGSIIGGALVTGLDAPTGNGAKKDPFPVLLRIKREAILPNRFRADIRECFLIASGFGDLSSERAYLRGESISCVRDDGGVIEARLDAYASGEDGKAGVRGRLVSKQGQMIARSLMAGFLQGTASAFTPQKVPSLNLTGLGTTGSSSSTTTDPVYERAINGNTLQVAGLNGAGKALERIADFYLQMAEGIFPIIEIDAAREIDFIVTRGASLKLKGAKQSVNTPHGDGLTNSVAGMLSSGNK